MSLQIICDALLALLLTVCVITDVRSRKIYNGALLPVWIVAVIAHAIFGGWHGAIFSLLGCLTGFGLLLIPYFMGGMGAGDVKLLAVVGALKGTGFVLKASLAMSLLGAFMAVIVLLLQPVVRRRLAWLVYFFFGLRSGVRLPLATGSGEASMSAAYPYGVAIAGGAAVIWLIQGWPL